MTMRWLFLILGILFISGCAISPPVNQILVVSKTDKAMLEVSQNDFDRLPLAEKIKSITNKYYSTCQQVKNFCIENSFLPNCKESCSDFYLIWNVSLNATLKSSVNPALFAQSLTKETFREYDAETKQEIINEGYFTDCEQIMDYCLNEESVEGCHKYCSKYLLEPSYSGDLFNNGSDVIIS